MGDLYSPDTVKSRTSSICPYLTLTLSIYCSGYSRACVQDSLIFLKKFNCLLIVSASLPSTRQEKGAAII